MKSSAKVFLDLGRAYENHDEVDKAIEQYSKAASLDSNNAAPLLRLGVLHGRRQNLASSNAAFDKAEALYKDSQNFEGSSEVFYQRGYLLSQIGRMPEAQSAAQQSLEVAKVRSVNYRRSFRPNSCGYYKHGSLNESAEHGPSK
ncbi:MAG: hypothetical protein ABJC10_04635 [Acidobacteriota bacterium]